MGKYKKKPIVIDAIQWTGHNADEIKEFAGEACNVIHSTGGSADGQGYPQDYIKITFKTLEGTMQAMEGDWIIKGIKGEFYPCKPEIFRETYEAVSNNVIKPKEIQMHWTIIAYFYLAGSIVLLWKWLLDVKLSKLNLVLYFLWCVFIFITFLAFKKRGD